MRRLAAILLTPACLAACAPLQAPSTPQSAEATAVVDNAAAHRSFVRYAALAPQTAAEPTAEQAPFFADIEQLLTGARNDTSAWNRELFLRTAQDQFWRYGLDAPTIERLGLAPEDANAFRALLWKRVEEIDTSNTAFLKAEVDRRGGWPAKSEVGDGASHFAWLLVQHADRDPAFQDRVLALMEPMVAAGEVDGKDFAYLFDRVAKAANRPQRYGTQGNCVAGEGRWAPFDMEDPTNIDARRAAVKLGTMADYTAIFKERRLCEGQ